MFLSTDGFFCDLLAASESHKGVLIIVPYFGETQLSGDDWNSASTGMSDNSTASLYWSSSNWMSGEFSFC